MQQHENLEHDDLRSPELDILVGFGERSPGRCVSVVAFGRPFKSGYLQHCQPFRAVSSLAGNAMSTWRSFSRCRKKMVPLTK